MNTGVYNDTVLDDAATRPRGAARSARHLVTVEIRGSNPLEDAFIEIPRSWPTAQTVQRFEWFSNERYELGWVNDALAELKQGRSVDVRPHGGSMRGKIESGQRVTLTPVNPADLQIDDVVLVEWKGNHLLHLIKDLTATDVLIGNNLGKLNGWAPTSAIRGRVSQVHSD